MANSIKEIRNAATTNWLVTYSYWDNRDNKTYENQIDISKKGGNEPSPSRVSASVSQRWAKKNYHAGEYNSISIVKIEPIV
jgi:hypothetical protein